MKINKTFFVLIVLISVLMLSSASAKDINTTNDNVISNIDSNNDDVIDNKVLSSLNDKDNSKNQTLSSSKNDDVLGDDSTASFSELNTLIKASQVGDTLVLSKDFAYDSGSDSINGINISKSITIDGDGHSIDGKGVARAFTVNADNVILKNLIIKSTFATTAGGAIVWNGDYGELIDSCIQNSNTTLSGSSSNVAGGGGIYWIGSNGLVKSSQFIDCFSSANGGSIAVDASNLRIIDTSFERGTSYRAGGIWFSRLAVNSSLTYSNFTKCRATQSNVNFASGAIFYQLSMGYIDHCRFVENSGRAAGAIGLPSTTSGNIYNSYFESNYGYSSGAVIIHDGNVVNCTFVNNIGAEDACAMKIGYTRVDNCNFSQNHFNTTGTAQTSLIYIASTGASVLNCNFNNNNLPNNLIYIAANINYVSFENSNITGNTLSNVFYATTGNKYSFKNMRITSNTISGVVFRFNNQTEINLVNNVIQGTLYPSGYSMKTFTPVEVLYVGPSATGDKSGSSRSNLITFSDAILKIDFDGTIYVTAGTYSLGSVTLNNYIHFIGDSKSNTIIKDSTIKFSTKYTSMESFDFVNTALSMSSSGITISNSIFQDFSSTATDVYLINSASAAKVSLINCAMNNINAQLFRVGNDADGLLIENVSLNKINTDSYLFNYATGNNANNYYRNINITNSNIGGILNYQTLSSSASKVYDSFQNIRIKNVAFNGIVFNSQNSQYANHQSFNNIYLEDVSCVNAFVFAKDSTITNIFMKNVTASGDLIIFNFETELSNLNLTEISANAILNFNSNLVKLYNFNLTNSKPKIAFLTSANSELDNLKIDNCEFSSFMGNLQEKVQLTNSVFSNFKGNVKGNGSNVKIVGCNFTNADVLSSSNNGGAVELIKGDNFIIDSCVFKGNFANNGGAVYIRGVSNSSYILNSKFIDNIASSNGGAVYIASGISYYIDSSTRATFGSSSRNNGLYDAGTISLMPIVWVSSSGTGDGSYTNPASLKKGYESVEPYGVIYFKGNTDTFSSLGSFEFNKPGLTFVGNKSTTLSNIPLVIGEYATGLTMSNFIFTQTTSVSAIIWNGVNGVIANCTFKDNGGTNIYHGAAIQVMQENLKILDSTFTNNIAGSDEEGYGGAIYCDINNLTVDNCKFSNNGVYSSGEHIYLTENSYNIVINNSQFTGGKITANIGLGSAIFVLSESNVIISNSVFTNNQASNGGAININGIISILTISNNTFSNNKATNGGAISFTSSVKNLVMNNNKYNTNNATSKGGAIYTVVQINENNSYFANNVAGSGGAIYLDSNADYSSIIYCNFTNNKGSGSALSVYANNLTIDNSIFIKNIGTEYGAIDANTGSYGLIILNSQFHNNTATGDAGALSFASSENNLYGYNLLFVGNSAVNGGACKLSGTNIRIANSKFNNNKATTNGGAIYLASGSNCSIAGCDFSGNNASYGGAIYVSIPYTVISNCTFTKNTAINNGGAIYIGVSNVGVLESKFVNNKANDGSAIFMLSDQSNFEIKKSNFENNIALDHGVIYLSSTNNLQLGENIFINNQPGDVSEYYYILTSSMFKASKLYVSPSGTGFGLIEESPMAYDQVWDAIENGGIIVFLEGEYELSRTITQNYTFVGMNGAVIKRSGNNKYLFVLQNGVVLNIENITLNAGVDVVSGSELNMDNVTFTVNSNDVGGINYQTGSTGSITNSKFIDTSNINDNHVVSVYGNVNINNTEFSGNSLTGSALYYGSTGSGNVSYSVFKDNTASNDVRNINISNIDTVKLSNNTYDVNVTYYITNSTYSSIAYINATFDAGVNFDINNIKITINDTNKFNTVVNVDGEDNSFSFDVGGKLPVGTYNLTISYNDGNVYDIIYNTKTFQITKANITINDIDDITLVYGANDTITITGSIHNNIYYDNNYTGIVSVIIGENDPVNVTVNKNGTFIVTVNVKAFDVGVYALNITVQGDNNFTGNNKILDSYLTVEEATIEIIDIDFITIEYGEEYFFVNGTLNSTKFGDYYNGNITVSINGLSNKTQAVNGTFSVKFTNSLPFTVGKYDITVYGDACDNYNPIASKSFINALEVVKVVPDFIILSPSVGYGENATIYINLPSDATGKVIINASGRYVIVIDNVYGVTNATIVLPVSGSYLINATYYGDDNYQNVTTNSTLFVERPRSTLNITVEDTFIGSDVLINFTVYSATTGEFFDDATGILRVYVGSQFYTLNITNGRGNLSVSGLSIAGYNVVAIYNGDQNYAGCDAYTNFQVKGYETELGITLNKNEIFVGDNVLVTVNINETINNYPIYLYVDGDLYGILLVENGVVVFNVTGLTAGTHNISAIFPATSAFGNASNKTTINVIKNNPNFNPEAVANSENIIHVKITLPDDATGIINITYNGVLLKNASVTGGSQTIQLDGVYGHGNYTFNITYSGDNKYYTDSHNSTVEVGKISDYSMNITSTVIVRDQDVTIIVNIPNSFGNNGTINLTINDILYPNLAVVNGSVNKTISTVGLDNFTVIAVYSGYSDDLFTYDSKTISRTFLVEPTDEYDVNITYDVAYVGDEVVLTINAPTQFNNVNFTVIVEGKEYTVSMVNGKGNFTVDELVFGTHEVAITTVDNKYFISKNIIDSFNVIRKTPMFNITDIPEVIYVNGEFTIKVENNLAGDAVISIFVDGVKVGEQLCSNNTFTIPGLTSGDHIITASFDGNDYYNGNSNSTSIGVLKLNSFVNASAENIDVGENLIVNVTASGNGSATVYIYNSANEKLGEYILSINNGEGTIIVPYKFTEIGVYNINITYNGDDVYNVSSNKTSFTVSLTTDYDFKVITTNAYVGGNVTVDVTLPNNANNNVILTLPNGTNVTKTAVNGSVQFIISDMAYGEYTINVTYVGDYNYAKGTKIGRFAVFKNDPNFSLRFNTTDESGLEVVNSIVAGDKTTLIIELPNDATGKVNITGNEISFLNRDLVNGKLNITLDSLTTGNYNINVSYTGDDKYEHSSKMIMLVVASTRTSLEILPISTQIVGDDVNVSVKSDAQGNITLYVNGIEFNKTEIVDGWANFTINSISGDVEHVNIFAVYESNGEYTSAFNSTTFDVVKYNTTIVATSNLFNVTVQVLAGATGNVIVTFNGINYTAVVNASTGSAVITLPKVSGSYNLPVYYLGDNRYNANSTTVSVVIPREDDYLFNVIVNATGYVTVKVNSTLSNNASISWDEGSLFNVPLNVVGYFKIGYYQLPANLTVGSHMVTVSYLGDGVYGSKSYSFIYTVEKIADYEFNVTVGDVEIGSDVVIYINLPVNATGFVVFDINGARYSVDLSDSHNLTLSGLSNGTYSVVAKYLGDGNYSESENTTEFTLTKRDSFVNLTVNNIDVGQTEIIKLTTPTDINGFILLKVNNNEYYVNIVNGTGSINITNLANGTYNVLALYGGNEIYEASNATKVFNVSKISNYNLDVVYSKVENNATYVNVTLPEDATGLITITVNNTNYTGVLFNGKTTIEVKNIIAQSYDYTLTWTGNDKYVNRTVSGVIHNDAFRNDSQIIVNVDNIYVDGSALIKVNVTSAATGNVRIVVNGKNILVPIVNGFASYSLGGFSDGNYTVVATYLGDDIYAQSTNSTTFEVFKYDSTITIETSEGKVGENITITITGPSDAKSNVVIIINGTTYNTVMSNGKATLNASFTKYGQYHMVATYNGDDKYYSSNNTSSFIVDSLTPSVVVSVDDIKVGENAIIVVTVPDDATGVVIITIEDDTYNATINGGRATFTIADLINQTYNVVATYNGDTKYESNTNSTLFNVAKVDIVPDVSSTLIVENKTNITVTVPTDASGNITLIVGENQYTTTINNGIARFNLNNVGNGTNITFVYNGDDKYNEFNSQATLLGSGIKLSSSLSILISNIRVGDDAIITITVTDKATGNITLNIGDIELLKEIVDGKVTFTVSDLAYGTYNVTAVYSGDNKFLKSNITSSISVNKYESVVVVTVSDIKVGDAAIITVSVPSDATGNVSLKINDIDYDPVSVSAGKAIFNIPNLSNGTYTVIATYNGNAKYFNSTSNASFKVSKVNITANIESTSVLDNKSNITVIVPNDATGNIIITVGETNYTASINDGKALIEVSNVGDGTNITIVYAGDDKYNGFVESATITDQGVRINSQISVSTDKDEYLAGETAIITVTVPQDARGNVTFKIRGETITTKLISNGYVVFEYVVPTSGSFNVETIYNGDTKYAKVSNTTSFTASKVNASVIVEVNNTAFDENVIIVVKVPSDATGQISIIVNGNTHTETIADGKAIFTLNPMGRGTYTVQATYNPLTDEKYMGNSNSSEFAITGKSTKLDVLVNPITYGEVAGGTVSVDSGATGYVTITIGNDVYLFNIKNGVANIAIPNLMPGEYTLLIEYAGDTNYDANSTTATLTVNYKTTTVDVTAEDIKKGETAIINAVVSSDATGIISITVNGKEYNVTINNGRSTIEISDLEAGTYNIVAKYLGNQYYANATNNTVSFNVMTDTTIITSTVTRGYGSEYDYEAVFTDSTGKPLANITVIFAVNGKEYNVTTDENGVARLPGGTLGVGNHTVVAINPLTGYETHNNAVILPVIGENKNIAMDFKDGSKYFVRVMGDDGKPVGAGVEVVITVNKVNYKVKTDSQGYARLTINLNPGTYTVSATHNGFKVSNKITIKRTLSAKKTQVAKKSKKVSKIKATLKWSSGKAIKSKKVTMKFRGKTYKAKTNSKGVVTFKLPKKAIKKLKIGKKYKVRFAFSTDRIYKYIKIAK